MKDFNKIVKYLWKKWWKILFKKDVFEIVDPECKQEYVSFVNKLIYRLKAEGYIMSLKSGVYIVPDKEDINLNTIDLVEKYYVKLLKKYITHFVSSQYYVSGVKSLELHMKDFSVPEKIYIINRNLNKKVLVWNYEIHFKTLKWKHQGKTLNLYSKFSKFTKEIDVDGTVLKMSCLELSLLESALVSDSYQWVNISLLIKAIKKYKTVLDYDIFREVGRYKYNMSVNRLKEISRTLDEDLYKLFLEIIKQNGWCFVGEGLRAI